MASRNIALRVAGLAVLGMMAVVFTACGDHDPGAATPTPDTTSPEAVASRFFHWYASERNLGRDPIASGAIEGNADVTPGLRLALKSAAAGGQPGVDPMLCSMSIPHAFELGKAEVSASSAEVTVGAESHANVWRVELQKDGSAWKIHAITCAVG
ncbi:MAG: hypothetical protein ACKVT1_03920 [Dehalococcoidia bacterium]